MNFQNLCCQIFINYWQLMRMPVGNHKAEFTQIRSILYMVFAIRRRHSSDVAWKERNLVCGGDRILLCDHSLMYKMFLHNMGDNWCPYCQQSMFYRQLSFNNTPCFYITVDNWHFDCHQQTTIFFPEKKMTVQGIFNCHCVASYKCLGVYMYI